MTGSLYFAGSGSIRGSKWVVDYFDTGSNSIATLAVNIPIDQPMTYNYYYDLMMADVQINVPVSFSFTNFNMVQLEEK